MYFIAGVVLTLVSFVAVEIIYAWYLKKKPKAKNQAALIQLSLTVVFTISTIVLSALSKGNMGSNIIWYATLPINGEINTVSDAPLYTFDLFLEKRDTPVYLKVESNGSHIQKVKLTMLAPNDSHVLYITEDNNLVCTRQVGCDPVIRKFLVKTSGK